MAKKEKALTRDEIEQIVKSAVKHSSVTPRDVEDSVRKVVSDTTLKEELWKDAVRDGVVEALWDMSGYSLIAVFTLMLTGIIVAAFLFSVLTYAVFKAVFLV